MSDPKQQPCSPAPPLPSVERDVNRESVDERAEVLRVLGPFAVAGKRYLEHPIAKDTPDTYTAFGDEVLVGSLRAAAALHARLSAALPICGLIPNDAEAAKGNPKTPQAIQKEDV